MVHLLEGPKKSTGKKDTHSFTLALQFFGHPPSRGHQLLRGLRSPFVQGSTLRGRIDGMARIGVMALAQIFCRLSFLPKAVSHGLTFGKQPQQTGGVWLLCFLRAWAELPQEAQRLFWSGACGEGETGACVSFWGTPKWLVSVLDSGWFPFWFQPTRALVKARGHPNVCFEGSPSQEVRVSPKVGAELQVFFWLPSPHFPKELVARNVQVSTPTSGNSRSPEGWGERPETSK